MLSFREAEPVVEMIRDQIENEPHLTPDYLMIDGNGILHPRKIGLASSIGVQLDLPTFGVAKNFYCLDAYYARHLDPKDVRDDFKKNLNLEEKGDFQDILHPEEKTVVGCALKTAKESTNPVYVSIGHKISLEKAKKLTLRTAQYRIPQPTRLADLVGREFVKKHLEKNGLN